jgi:hypothetical protein
VVTTAAGVDFGGEEGDMSDPVQAGGSHTLKFSILFGAVLALAAANVYLYLELEDTQAAMAEDNQALVAELSSLRESSVVTSNTQRERLEAIRAELDTARKQAAAAVGSAKQDAEKLAASLETRLATEQRQMATQLSQKVEAVQTDANTRLATVDTRVTGVKTDVEKTRAELEKATSELKRMQGDMGEMSGLIATNKTELGMLRQLGERDYVEFNIRKSKDPIRVGTVALKLRKADTKRSRFDVELYADDRKVDKKDKYINEPVQFYVSDSKLPYEIVVNQVLKDQIIGYLAIPKVKVQRAAGPS